MTPTYQAVAEHEINFLDFLFHGKVAPQNIHSWALCLFYVLYFGLLRSIIAIDQLQW